MGEALQIQLFLVRLKRIWNTPGRIILAPREKNLQSMAELDITMKDVKEICLGLRPEDRKIGPVPHDHGHAGEVWVFTPMYNGNMIYLKLWLSTYSGVDYVQIISCHREGMI